jgi:hypothetical protein
VLQTQTIRIKNAVAEVIYLHYQNDYQTIYLVNLMRE